MERVIKNTWSSYKNIQKKRKIEEKEELIKNARILFKPEKTIMSPWKLTQCL